VKIRTQAQTREITIVGVDEADPARGQVSWISPMAKALLKARAGDVVTLRSPAGEEQLEIMEVSYR
jgi:transcription elongation factor GreB